MATKASDKYSTAQLIRARKVLKKRGMTRQQFADHLGVNRNLVDAVLSGQIKGLYGVSHRIAVAVGLKKPVRDELPDV